MRQRCENKNNNRYDSWGGRGIRVCDRWSQSFENFIEDMGIRPSYNHTLDRKDNDKGYCKENCRWATKKEQALNRRSNLMINYKGEIKPLTEWTDILGLPYCKVRQRIKKLNWTPEEAFES